MTTYSPLDPPDFAVLAATLDPNKMSTEVLRWLDCMMRTHPSIRYVKFPIPDWLLALKKPSAPSVNPWQTITSVQIQEAFRNVFNQHDLPLIQHQKTVSYTIHESNDPNRARGLRPKKKNKKNSRPPTSIPLLIKQVSFVGGFGYFFQLPPDSPAATHTSFYHDGEVLFEIVQSRDQYAHHVQISDSQPFFAHCADVFSVDLSSTLTKSQRLCTSDTDLGSVITSESVAQHIPFLRHLCRSLTKGDTHYMMRVSFNQVWKNKIQPVLDAYNKEVELLMEKKRLERERMIILRLENCVQDCVKMPKEMILKYINTLSSYQHLLPQHVLDEMSATVNQYEEQLLTFLDCSQGMGEAVDSAGYHQLSSRYQEFCIQSLTTLIALATSSPAFQSSSNCNGDTSDIPEDDGNGDVVNETDTTLLHSVNILNHVIPLDVHTAPLQAYTHDALRQYHHYFSNSLENKKQSKHRHNTNPHNIVNNIFPDQTPLTSQISSILTNINASLQATCVDDTEDNHSPDTEELLEHQLKLNQYRHDQQLRQQHISLYQDYRQETEGITQSYQQQLAEKDQLLADKQQQLATQQQELVTQQQQNEQQTQLIAQKDAIIAEKDKHILLLLEKLAK